MGIQLRCRRLRLHRSAIKPTQPQGLLIFLLALQHSEEVLRLALFVTTPTHRAMKAITAVHGEAWAEETPLPKGFGRMLIPSQPITQLVQTTMPPAQAQSQWLLAYQ